MDLDGTLTGNVDGAVAPYFGFNNLPECPRAGKLFEYGSVCNSSVRIRRLQIDSVSPKELDYQPLKLTGDYGNANVGFRVKENYGWVAPVVTHHTYKAAFLSQVDFQLMRIRYSEPEYIEPGEWMHLSFNYTSSRYQFLVTYSNTSASVPTVPDPTYNLLPSHPFGT